MMPQTREAVAALQYGVTARKGLIVLTGEVGTGKTTILRRVLDSFERDRVIYSLVFNPGTDILDLLEFILADFGITPLSHSKSGMLIPLNHWLIERFRQDQNCVIVLDESQNLSTEMLEEVRLLTNLETSSEKLIQVILSGQPELEAKLRRPELRQLRQRVSLWARTESLNERQTGEYIAERLRIAGAKKTIFLPDAIHAIHVASRGIPRLINVLCEHALIFAYVEQAATISAPIIADVVRDLDLIPQNLPGTGTQEGLSAPLEDERQDQ